MTPSIAVLLVDATERFLGDALDRLAVAGFPDLSVSQAFAIQLVDGGVNTITSLAAVMRMSPQAVSAIVDQLERGGLVARTRPAQDGRTRILALTDEGRDLGVAIAQALADAERAWATLVGEERLAEFASVLQRLAADGGESPPQRAGRRRRRRVRIT